MGEEMRTGVRRAAAWLGVLAVTVGLGVACSSQPGGTPAESTASTSDALSYCGAPFSMNVGIREVTAFTTVSYHQLTPAGGVVVPLELSLSGASGITSGRVVNGVLAFNTPSGAVTCSYQQTAGASPPIRLPFVSCTNGAMVGAPIGNTQTALSGTVSGSAFASGTLSISNLVTTVDDGLPCTIDGCDAFNAPTHMSAPAGTSCEDGLVCNGINTCDGAGACIAGTPPPKDDGDPCTTDGPSSCTEPYGYTHTKITGCGAPANVPSYPGGGQVPSDFASGVSFIANTQPGLTTNILSQRAAVIRGRVVDRDSQMPIVGAYVSIVGQNGYGSTQTRSDGFYDLLVNGGDKFTIQVVKTGTPSYPTVQRKVETRWLDFSVVPDIALVPFDVATQVAVDGSGRTDTSWHVVTATKTTAAMDPGSVERTARIFIPPQTTIGGWTPTAGNVGFRITEYTVGPAGPSAMPAELPFNSAYTYASELSIDQVPNPTFSNAYGNNVIFYVEHFAGDPLNALGQSSVSVPSGSYDRAAGAWKVEQSGDIIRILSVSGGIAALSRDGTNPMSGTDQTALGITTGELQQLGTTYPSANNLDLWRVRMSHFTPYDLNWNAGVHKDAVGPPRAPPRADTPKSCPLKKPGSVIECEDQVLGESIPIAGTPFSLNYRSESQSGYQPTLIIPISDGGAIAGISSSPTTAPYFDHGEVEINVAGRHVLINFAKPGANERVRWTWDRNDAYGRMVQGTTVAHVRVSYVYRATRSNFTSDFGSFGSLTASFPTSRPMRTISLDNSYDVPVGGLDAKQLGLGGWTLSPVHVYEPQSQVVWYGDGTKRIPATLGDTISTVATSAVDGFTTALATGDGSIYVGRWTGSSATNGLGKLVSGSWTQLSSTGSNRNIVSGSTQLGSLSVEPYWMSLGPDGRIYVSDVDQGYRIFSFDPATLVVYNVLGRADGLGPTNGSIPVSPDGTSAVGAPMGRIRLGTFGPDGLLYFVENPQLAGQTAIIRRVRSDGKLETVAGSSSLTGTVAASCASTNDCPARSQPLGLAVEAITFDNQGRLLFADGGGLRVWRIEPDNTLRLVAGSGGSGVNDGGPATNAAIQVKSMRFFRGILYLMDTANAVVRRVTPDGVISRVAGNGSGTAVVNNGPATASYVRATDLALSPDGKFYVPDVTRVRRFGQTLDPFVGSTYVVSDDGSEVYQFDASGRHTATKSAYRGTNLLQFDYWANGSGKDGKLWKITDTTAAATGITPDHNVTVIDYPSSTSATITSPYGVVTTLTLDSNGLATKVSSSVPGAWGVSNPTREWNLAYTNGMLTVFTDPKLQNHTFAYTPTGLLASDANALSFPYATTLKRAESNTSDGVEMSTPEYRTSSHVVDLARTTADAARYERRTHTDPAGIVWYDDRRKNGTETITSPQLPNETNTVVTTVSGDARFGFGTPYTSKVVTTAGASGAKNNTVTVTASASLTNTNDPFSLVTSATAMTTTTTYAASSGNPIGQVQESYDRNLSQRTTLTGLGRSTVETLDAADRTTGVSYSGKIPNATLPSPATEAYVYDGAGRVSQESVTAGGTTRSVTYGYDTTKGWLGSVTATGLGSVSYANWDATGRPQQITLPGSRVVNLTYDFNGNVASVQTPLGYTHLLGVNGKDLLALYTPPSVSPGGNTQYVYDRDGLIAALGEPVDSINYERDGAGRLVREKYYTAQGFQTLTTSYDAAGHVSSIASNLSPAVTLTYGYDGDMVTSEQYSNAFTTTHAMKKAYDGFQRVTTQQFDSDTHAFGFNYDGDGLLSSVTAGSYTYTLDRTASSLPSAHGLVATATTTVGTTTKLTELYEYDAFGALVHYKATINNTSPTPPTVAYEVTYGRESGTGRVSSKTETLGGAVSNCRVDYVYDARNFLQSATRNSACGVIQGVSSWVYDDDGNINSLSAGGPWVYNQQDRIVYDGTWTFGYDGDGNLTGGTAGASCFAFNYDAPGNLRRGGVCSNQYDYRVDGRNRRVARVLGSVLQKGWMYDGNRIVAEIDSTGAVVSHFAYATKTNTPDLMWHLDGAVWNLYRIVTDQLGSPMVLINLTAGSDPTVDPEKYFWSDWGLPYQWIASYPAGAAPSKQPFAFAGGLYDPGVGIYRFGARDYNPWVGRWWSKDPIRFAGNLNLYVYANNDPVNFVDHNGRLPEFVEWFVTVFSVYMCRLFGVLCPKPFQSPDRGWIGGEPPPGPANDNRATCVAGASSRAPKKDRGSCVLERDLYSVSTMTRYCLYYCDNSDFAEDGQTGEYLLQTWPPFMSGPALPCQDVLYQRPGRE